MKPSASEGIVGMLIIFVGFAGLIALIWFSMDYVTNYKKTHDTSPFLTEDFDTGCITASNDVERQDVIWRLCPTNKQGHSVEYYDGWQAGYDVLYPLWQDEMKKEIDCQMTLDKPEMDKWIAEAVAKQKEYERTHGVATTSPRLLNEAIRAYDPFKPCIRGKILDVNCPPR